jgi:hypothetical protein
MGSALRRKFGFDLSAPKLSQYKAPRHETLNHKNLDKWVFSGISCFDANVIGFASELAAIIWHSDQPSFRSTSYFSLKR